MAYGEDSDERLMARAGAGDRVAAGLLVTRHADRVFAVCYRLLGARDAAEDAAQETFLRLWTNAARWRAGEAKLATWLYRVASNVCLDRLRRRGREAPEDAAPERADDAPLADEQMAAADRRAVVAEAVAKLPDRQRQALVLSHYEELSNGETAEIMEISVEAVESLLARARRNLKQALAGRRGELMQAG